MKQQHNEDGEHWLSVSDMMSGLMVIFLFIAISYMIQVQEDKKKLIDIAVTYEKTRELICQQLKAEFINDLTKWNAEIKCETLAVRFENPEVLFHIGEAELRSQFKTILDDFFPRYINQLAAYYTDIEEIRIEGHTSSEWRTKDVSVEQAYFLNMALSQDRTRAVLEYCLMLPQVEANRPWIKANLTANGLSSSKPISVDGQENAEKSRRVEFRVKTNSEKQIVKILQGN